MKLAHKAKFLGTIRYRRFVNLTALWKRRLCSVTDKGFPSINMATVYLDYNATTPLAPEVLESITATLRDAWGNPSSSHHAGLKARQCIAEARCSVAAMINAQHKDILFTSGGTESNNMVFDSIAKHYHDQNVAKGDQSLPHVIISNLEHDSVDLTAREMEKRKRIELSVVNVDPSTGSVRPQDVVGLLRPNTSLVSIMLANNETGVIQPICEVVRAVRRWEGDGGRKGRVLVHTDAAQALGKIAVDATDLGVDYLTIVGHKFYGPRIGALYVRDLESRKVPLYPLLYGGGQERGFRSGTENTGMIAGLGKAAQLIADNVDSYKSHMAEVRDYLEDRLKAEFGQQIHFNSHFIGSERIPNTSNISLIGPGLQGNLVLSALERSQASLGAACHSHDGAKPSPILLACGVPEEIAINALRVSVGRETTKKDIDVFVDDLKNAANKMSQV